MPYPKAGNSFLCLVGVFGSAGAPAEREQEILGGSRMTKAKNKIVDPEFEKLVAKDFTRIPRNFWWAYTWITQCRVTVRIGHQAGKVEGAI